MTPDLSIEITTFNRKDVLGRVLEGLAEQTHPADRFEVVLSDDGSNDGLLEMVDGMAPELPYALRVLRHQHQGPGHAHNCGIQACQAEIVLMIAADILPSPDLVAEHLRSHREKPDPTVVVSGRLRQSEELPDTVFQRVHGRYVEAVLASESSWVLHGGFLVNNLSFKKSFMLEHGMFQEWPPASDEDLELGQRLRRQGMAIIENPRALGHHHHEESHFSVAKRAYTRGYNSHHWVERPQAPPASGLVPRLKAGLRALLLPVLENRITMQLVVMPLLRSAESVKLLGPIVPSLYLRLSSYHYDAGVRDHRNGRPLHHSLGEP